MKEVFIVLALLVVVMVVGKAEEQFLEPIYAGNYGGEANLGGWNEEQRQKAYQDIIGYENTLSQEDLKRSSTSPHPLLIHPLKLTQKPGFTLRSGWVITNFVDHDPMVSLKNRKDWNCGTRTYDKQASQTNHRGTDFSLSPFGWSMMDADVVEVVAAADGVISSKADGNYDRNCADNCSSCTTNYVSIRHSDGSFASYVHLKNNSVTNKTKGSAIKQGEYIGIVGSSGLAAWPHLHFEMGMVVNKTLIDPWFGPCNPTITESWWIKQEPYYVPDIKDMFASTAKPLIPNCDLDTTFRIELFPSNASSIFVSSFLRDVEANQTVSLNIFSSLNGINVTYKAKPKIFERRYQLTGNYMFSVNASRTGSYILTANHKGITCWTRFAIGNWSSGEGPMNITCEFYGDNNNNNNNSDEDNSETNNKGSYNSNNINNAGKLKLSFIFFAMTIIFLLIF